VIEVISYHLEPLLHGSSTLEVLGSGVDVVVDRLLRQINHVGREEGLAVLLEVCLVGVEETIEPGEELLGAVVGVENDGDAVAGGNAADVVSSGDTTGNGSGLAIVANALRELDRTRFPEGLEFTLPAKKAAPPWETWRITGQFWSRAASRQATTVEEEVTFCSVVRII
jgi:hypothetical protein